MKWTATVRIDDVLYDIHSDVEEADEETGMDEIIEPYAAFAHNTMPIDHLSIDTQIKIANKLSHRDLYINE